MMISVLDITYPFYAGTVNERFKLIADALVSEEQNGFRKGRSCKDAKCKLKLFPEKRREFFMTNA